MMLMCHGVDSKCCIKVSLERTIYRKGVCS